MSNPPPPTGSAPGQSNPDALSPRVLIKPKRVAGDRGPAPTWALTWATFFGAGYFPVAPGTAGTAAAIPLWWALTYAPRWEYFAVTAVIIWTGVIAAERAGKYYGVADSGHIVVDEVAGYLVTMAFLPRGFFAALAGFVMFRICDVVKPWPAYLFDRLPRWKNGTGVVLDDVFAAVWACALTWGAVWLRQRFFPGP